MAQRREGDGHIQKYRELQGGGGGGSSRSCYIFHPQNPTLAHQLRAVEHQNQPARLFSLLPPAHSLKLQSSEPYPKCHTIIWKIHKYSLGWFSASLDGFTDLCKSGTHRFHHYLFATANTASVLAASHRRHHHHHRRHSSAEALLFAKLIATIISRSHLTNGRQQSSYLEFVYVHPITI